MNHLTIERATNGWIVSIKPDDDGNVAVISVVGMTIGAPAPKDTVFVYATDEALLAGLPAILATVK